MNLLLLLCLLIGGGLYAWAGLDRGALTAVLAGTMIAWLYVGSGFISFHRFRFRPSRSFGRFFIYSFAGRLAAVAAIVLVLLRCTEMENPPFLISLLVCYFIFQIWEVISLHRLEIGKS